jgi:hypothetical protein
MMGTRLRRLACLAVDHRPQASEPSRSGTRFLICTRCNRFLGLAGGQRSSPMPHGFSAAAQLVASVKTKSAR